MNDTTRMPCSVSFRKLLVACSALISVTALQVGVARADNAIHDGFGTGMTAPKAPKMNVVAADANLVAAAVQPVVQAAPALPALEAAADVTWSEGFAMDSGAEALPGSAMVDALSAIGDTTIEDMASVAMQAANEDVSPPAADELKGFEQVAALAPSDLSDLRGGFVTNTGVVINFGFDISTRLGGVLRDHVHMDSSGTVTKNGNAFTIPSNGVVIDDVVDNNGGKTHFKFSVGSNGIQNIIQNSANNQIIQSQGTFSLETTGLSQALKGAAGNANLINALQSAFRRRH